MARSRISSLQAPRHREVAEEMVKRGTAFRCYMTAEEQEAQRNAAHAEGRAIRSPYRDGKAPPSPDALFTVRLRAPDEGDVLNADLIQGDVRIKARDIDDLVLLRADSAIPRTCCPSWSMTMTWELRT